MDEIDDFTKLKSNAKEQQDLIDEMQNKGSKHFVEHIQQVSTLQANAAPYAKDDFESSKMLKNAGVVTKKLIEHQDMIHNEQIKAAYHLTIDYQCQALVKLNKCHLDIHKQYKSNLEEKVESQIYNFSNYLQQTYQIKQIDDRITPMNSLLQTIIKAHFNSPAIQFIVLNLVEWATKFSQIGQKDEWSKSLAIIKRQEQNAQYIKDNFTYLIREDTNAQLVLKEQQIQLTSMNIQKDYKKANSLFEHDQDANLEDAKDQILQALSSVRKDLFLQDNETHIKDLIDLEVQCQVFSSYIIILRQDMLLHNQYFHGFHDKIADAYQDLMRLLLLAQGDNSDLFETYNQVNSIRKSIAKEKAELTKKQEELCEKKNKKSVDWIRNEGNKAVNDRAEIKKKTAIQFKQLVEKFPPKNAELNLDIPFKFSTQAAIKKCAVRLQMQQHPDKNIGYGQDWEQISSQISIKINDIIAIFKSVSADDDKTDSQKSDVTGEQQENDN